MKIAFVAFDGNVLELIEEAGDVPFHKDGVLNHITFDVEDIHQAVDEFTGAGATFFVPPMSLGSGQVAFATGVNGEVIELFQV
jgi:predicted enzyme related to lactoylglutathione lyase